MQNITLNLLLLTCMSLPSLLNAAPLEPLISRKGDLLFEDSFDSGEAKPEWKALHGTRWSVQDGAYVGIPSPKEYQENRDNHTGSTPSMTLHVPARDCTLQMSIKITGKLAAAHIGFNEGTTAETTGHIFRLIIGVDSGTVFQKDRNSQVQGDKDQILLNSDWKPKRDTWYTVMLETRGSEAVAQIEGGPTLIVRNARLDVPKAWGNFKARGKEGSLQYDNVRIWEALPLDVENTGWKKHTIVDSESGGINSAVSDDFDRDGYRDVIASYGRRVSILKGPDWRPTTIHEFQRGLSRNNPGSACIHSCLLDVDGDGDLDFVGSNNTVFWLECPDEPFSGEPWTYRVVDDEILGTHCLITGDVNRDGRVDLIANSFKTTPSTRIPNSITWIETPRNLKKSDEWTRHVFAANDAPGGSHYMGFGDVNDDGRPEIVAGAKGGNGFEGGEWFAYWEQPEDPTRTWKKHMLSDRQPGASNIHPGDLNGDGHTDFIASRGHGAGLLWFKGPHFEAIEIDEKIVGPHSLILEDLDNDGDLDVATCGRFETSTVAWYENDGSANFEKHIIDVNQGSYDMRAEDMDGDGDLDFLIAGHWSGNVVWYEKL